MLGGERFTKILTDARALWPRVVLDDDVFLAFLEPRTAEPAVLDELHTGDLYLACACLRHDRQALNELERRFFPEVALAIRPIDPNPAFADEVVQILRQKLLVADGETPPRLDSYSGLGPLAGWLRVAGMRAALSLRRQDRREVPLEEALLDAPDPQPTPEQKLLLQRHGDELRAALREAIGAQPARIRAVLRLYYADGQGVEAIGRIYNVHASTISRWLARARQSILEDTRAGLAGRLGLSESQVDSLLGLARSLEVSLRGLLASEPAAQ